MTRLVSIHTVPLLVGLLALAACPSDDSTPIDTEGTSTGGGDTTMGPVTTPPTTVDSGSADDTATTAVDPTTGGGEQCEPECPFGQCCVAGACFNAPPPTCAGGCAANEDCVCPEGEDPCGCAGECVPSECGGEGTYEPCSDTMCPAGYACITDSGNTVSWCALQGCGSACDCPMTPEGFEAQCTDITGTGTLFCSIACDANSCPDGMICFGNGIACVWPGEEPEPQYGDCVNGGPCEAGLQCISDQAGTFGWCGTIGCMDDTPCQPPPGTGDAPAVCAPINAMTSACQLDCSMGQTCPDGMSCLEGPSICVWTEQLSGPGYEPCIQPIDGCATGQTCLDDGTMDPAWEVCAQEGCTDPGDCVLDVPTTGDAPVACGDPTGAGANACYLDCSAGQTCPDGMACIDDALCGWPQGTEIFADDFEDGDLTTPAWTLYDEDGLVPAMEVAFVNAAWVASSAVAPPNSAAVATSWYVPAGQSDDWMVTPQLMLTANPRLSWVSRSLNASFPDGLEVLVSTTGNTPADFTDPPVLVANPESEAFAAHVVDLTAYANQSVYIAFRSVGNDGVVLLVDNVSVQNLP